MKKALSLLAVILMLTMVLTACGGDNNANNSDNQFTGNNITLDSGNTIATQAPATQTNSIVGTWGATIDGIYGEFIFYADNSGAIVVDGDADDFAWTISGTNLVMTNTAGDVATVPFVLNGDQLTLTINGQTQTLTRANSTSTQTPNTNATLDQALIGTWGATIDGVYGEFAFYANGNGTSSSEGEVENLTWSTSGNQLNMTVEGFSISFTYAINGNQLALTYGGQTQTLYKK